MKRFAPLLIFVALVGGFFARAGIAGAQSDGTDTPDSTFTSQGNAIPSDGQTQTDTATSNDATDATDQIPADISSYDSSTNASDIDADVDPQNPGAFTNVTVTLDSNIVDLRRYQITWYVNGQEVGGGIGKYTLLAETKGYGQTTNIRAIISLDTGDITKDITLIPEDMTMMWEAVDAYAPPFYQGKKLPARESIIKIVAIPNFIQNGTALNPSDAVYNWTRNGNVVTTDSGYGNDELLIKQDKLNASEQIEATASDDADDISATGDITIPLFDPKILFYAIDPITGIKSPIAQNSINFAGPSATIVAEPYGFSVPNNNPDALAFSWTMNNDPITITDGNNQQTLDLQNPGGSGFATIGLSIADPDTSFQTAQSEISALFGNQDQSQ